MLILCLLEMLTHVFLEEALNIRALNLSSRRETQPLLLLQRRYLLLKRLLLILRATRLPPLDIKLVVCSSKPLLAQIGIRRLLEVILRLLHEPLLSRRCFLRLPPGLQLCSLRMKRLRRHSKSINYRTS